MFRQIITDYPPLFYMILFHNTRPNPGENFLIYFTTYRPELYLPYQLLISSVLDLSIDEAN